MNDNVTKLKANFPETSICDKEETTGSEFTENQLYSDVIPDEVNVYNNNTVVFRYGNEAVKTTTQGTDEFDLIHGIEICILKKLLGGTSEYNRIVRKCVKIHEDAELEKIRERNRKKYEEAIRRGKYLKCQEKKAKQREKLKAEIIDMIRQATLMNEI